MKSLLDHDVPEDLTYLLQELGHEVLRLRDVLRQEAADLVVRQFADQYSCGGRGGAYHSLGSNSLRGQRYVWI